jgi:hypothetical protein
MRGADLSRDAISATNRRVTQRPDIIPSTPYASNLIVVDQGNTLETGQDGIVY